MAEDLLYVLHKLCVYVFCVYMFSLYFLKLRKLIERERCRHLSSGVQTCMLRKKELCLLVYSQFTVLIILLKIANNIIWLFYFSLYQGLSLYLAYIDVKSMGMGKIDWLKDNTENINSDVIWYTSEVIE